MRAIEKPRILRSARAMSVGFATAFCVAVVFVPAQAQQSASGGQPQITFTKHVAPIFQKACQSCHRPGSVAPMSLLTYEDVRPWARLIKQKVTTRVMPPWHIDRNVGIQTFKDDRSLTDREIATVARWVDGGAPRGNPADMPPPLTFDNARYEWTLKDEMGRNPDLIVEIPEPFLVPATISNWWVDLISDTGLTEDRYIRAMETKPSLQGFPVVHHASTYMFLPSALISRSRSARMRARQDRRHPSGRHRALDEGGHEAAMEHALLGEPQSRRHLRSDEHRVLVLSIKNCVPKHKLTRQSVGNVTDLDFGPAESNVMRMAIRCWTTISVSPCSSPTCTISGSASAWKRSTRTAACRR